MTSSKRLGPHRPTNRMKITQSLQRLRSVTTPGELRRHGVLGLNRRNADLLLQSNPRALCPLVDDKLATKRICQELGLSVPETYAVIERQGDVRRFEELIGPRAEFVIKPASGAAGRGVLVLARRGDHGYQKPDGERFSSADIRSHLSTILSGLYSLGGQRDRVLVEQRIGCHPSFRKIAVGGTPDIRVIVYRGVPILAMVRLPTAASGGRANLHQGAIGAGVNFATGRTVGGVMDNQFITVHPDTGESVEGFEIPFWAPIVRAAGRLASGLKLGYVGIDFVVDGVLGSVVLEANARPGLAIQIANRCGLIPRLEMVESGTGKSAYPGS